MGDSVRGCLSLDLHVVGIPVVLYLLFSEHQYALIRNNAYSDIAW